MRSLSLQHFLLVVVTCLIRRSDSKCTTGIVTTCEDVSDLHRYGKASWQDLIVQKDPCARSAAKHNAVLQRDAFNKFPNIEQLYISETLHDVSSGAFSGLKKLRYLKLWGNRITVLQPKSFSGLESVYNIDLRDNGIENMAHGLFQDCNVVEVDMSFNKFSNIQVNMLDLPTLQTLHMTNNAISFLADGALHPNLEHLDFSHNKIEDLRDDVFKKLNNLKTLKLSHNKFRQISKIKGLEGLEYLDLSYNKITDVGRLSFENLKNLQQLYLNNNQLNALSPTAFATKNDKFPIHTLHLHRNKLTYLDFELGKRLPDIKEITLRGNPWSCSCLMEIKNYVRAQMMQLPECDKLFYDEGVRPVCVISNKKECSGSETYEGVVYEQFEATVSQFECD